MTRVWRVSDCFRHFRATKRRLAEKLDFNKTAKDYWYINQAETTIVGVDDKEEYQLTDVRTLFSCPFNAKQSYRRRSTCLTSRWTTRSTV